MSRRKIKGGTTGLTVPIFIQDITLASSGGGLGSLVYNTSSLAAKYRRQGDSTWTPISLQSKTLGTFATGGGGFIADGGPVTGGYEFDIPNAALQSGATWCEVALYGATNMLPVLLEFELDAIDYQDGVRGGLSALPFASANSNGGIPILSNSGSTLAYTVSTVSSVNSLATGAMTANSIAADAITAAKLAADVMTELQTGLATASALAAAQTVLDDVKLKTDNLPADPASAADIASAFSTVNSTLATIGSYIDTEVPSIKTVTDHLATAIESDGAAYRFTANALAQGGAGGSSTVYVYPLTATLPPSAIFSSGTTQGFQYTPLPVGPIAIFDANQTPIDLSGAVLQMILTRTTDPNDIITLTSETGELTVDGADSNQVSVDYTPTFAGEYEWKLYRQEAEPADWTVLAIGFWNIEVGEDPA